MFKTQRVQITSIGLYAPHVDMLLGLAKERKASASAVIRQLLEAEQERQKKNPAPKAIGAGS